MPRGAVTKDIPMFPGGVREDLPVDRLPDGAWLSASNFLCRANRGRPRPGYTQVGSTLAAADAVIGFGFRGSPETVSNLITHTLTKAYSYDGSTFSDITGTWTTSTATQPVRMVPFWDSTTLVILRVNEANAVDKWTGSSTFADATGAPKARDITVCANRVILGYITTGGTFSNRVQWSGFKDCDSWTATDFDEAIETPGDIIAVRALGPLSFAVYKDDAVIVGQLAPTNTTFQFQFAGATVGPASPSAVVEAFGVHYWLGTNGLIYKFDGTRPQQVSAALSSTAIRNFAYTRRMEAHGCLLKVPEPEIWWWYPDSGASTIASAVCLNLATMAVTPHTFAHSITASAAWLSQGALTYDTLAGTMDGLADLYATYDAMTSAAQPTLVLGESTGVVDQFGLSLADRSTAIEWEVVAGWQQPNPGDELFVDAVDTRWRTTASALDVTVGLTATDALGDDDTESTTTLDISTGETEAGFDTAIVGRWFKARLAGDEQVEAMELRGLEIVGWARRGA